MSQERKRVEPKQLQKTEPKKRPEPVEELPESKVKTKLEDKFVKVAMGESSSVFKAIGDRIQKGELGPPYFTTENDKGYLYYLIKK